MLTGRFQGARLLFLRGYRGRSPTIGCDDGDDREAFPEHRSAGRYQRQHQSRQRVREAQKERESGNTIKRDCAAHDNDRGEGDGACQSMHRRDAVEISQSHRRRFASPSNT